MCCMYIPGDVFTPASASTLQHQQQQQQQPLPGSRVQPAGTGLSGNNKRQRHLSDDEEQELDLERM